MEPRITVNLKQLEGLTKRFPEASRQARQARIAESLLLLEAAIEKLTPEGAGPIHVRDTIFSQTGLRGESVWGMVGTPALYGESLEHGTKPHFPPIAPIRFWVEKKLRMTGPAAQSAAFCIARAIARRGTKGARMFGRGFEMNEGKVVSILQRIPEDIVNRVNG